MLQGLSMLLQQAQQVLAMYVCQVILPAGCGHPAHQQQSQRLSAFCMLLQQPQ